MIPRFRHIIILAAAMMITISLVWFAFSSANLILIQIKPQFQGSGIHVLSTDTLLRSSHPSEVYIDIRAFLEDESISTLKLYIRPFVTPNWYYQGENDVSEGFASATAQLGSPAFPVTGSEQYTYRLTSADGTLLSEGEIATSVEQVAGSERWIIICIGIFASVIQIVSLVVSMLIERRRATQVDRMTSQ